ncbi:MAG: hypothetical protein ACRD3Q_19770 [Terriglobales bacterium]
MSAPIAAASDVSTLDAILHAMYDVISGPAGQPRDWDRFRSLYHPEARLIPVSVAGGQIRPRLLSLDDYIRRVEPIFAAEDFWEIETAREVETIDAIAHVLSSYQSVRAPGGEPFHTGRNSIQLVFDGARWTILNVMWCTPRSE